MLHIAHQLVTNFVCLLFGAGRLISHENNLLVAALVKKTKKNKKLNHTVNVL